MPCFVSVLRVYYTYVCGDIEGLLNSDLYGGQPSSRLAPS